MRHAARRCCAAPAFCLKGAGARRLDVRQRDSLKRNRELALARQDDTNSQPGSPQPKPKARDERAERLAAALRENLLKRKAQARGRRAEEGEASAPARDGDNQAR
jgi:hypothetical protein